nr:type II toxin-antitoxin system VapC family toxin [Actinomycetales bacterium]
VRRGVLEPAVVDDLLSRVNLIAVEGADFVSAGRARTGLRSADAIHLAVALRVQAEEMITYDLELAEAARLAGIARRSPR